MANTVTYNTKDVSPVDALWALIQGQTKAVRVALTKRLLEQQHDTEVVENINISDFSKRIQAIENDPDGFFKLGGFMADSKSTAEELLSEAVFDKYGV